MRDKSHMEQVERWAIFVREHPTEWKKIHTEFINAQFQKANEFIERLAQQPGGKEKIKKLYNITNPEAYKKLLG